MRKATVTVRNEKALNLVCGNLHKPLQTIILALCKFSLETDCVSWKLITKLAKKLPYFTYNPLSSDYLGAFQMVLC